MAVIGTIRQKLGGLLILVIAFAMFAFILMDMGGKGNGPERGTGIAKVNGEEISYEDFSERLKVNETYMQNQLQGEPLSEAQKESVRNNTYNEMLTERLKAGLYISLGITVGDEEKKAMLFEDGFQHPSITSSFKGEDGQYSAANFKQYLETLNVPDPNSGLSAEEKRAQWTNFEQAIYKERADNKYNKLIAKSTKVPTWMAEVLYNNENEKANAEYIYLPFSNVADDSISYTDADLLAYLAEHGKEYQQEASVSLKYIVYPIEPSTDDINAVSSWMTNKFASWEKAESDSLFIMASSETKWSNVYKSRAELSNQFVDSMFNAPVGSFFGPVKQGNQFIAYKLVDRKAIPDSVQVRHLLISGEGYESQEIALALIDSLKGLIIDNGASLASLTAQFSQDESNAFNGGDLGWVRPSEMVVPFNNAIFFDMKVGDVKMVYSQFGAHFVEVYAWGTTSTSVKVATLNKTIFASEETTNNIFAEASLYSGNNRSKESFVAGSDKVKDAVGVSKKSNTIQGIRGNARELVKWAFNNDKGEVSAPFMVGESFVVTLQDGKSEEGEASLDNVRLLVEAEVIKNKKSEVLLSKVKGTDLNSIASSNSISVQSANDVSMFNVALAGIGNEPKFAGTALGATLNMVSQAFVGENGVFVLKTITKSEVPIATDLTAYKLRSSSYSGAVQGRLFEALKSAAKIEDNSFDFF
jgi:peptidyl-prolyl cis-trans isomerase D